MAVSPHADDAVFGCGAMLAQHPGALVITVFGGAPPPRIALTDWDAAAGFSSSAQAMRARRSEDRAALDRLGARGRWLAFRDRQYGRPPAVSRVASALVSAWRRLAPRRGLLPLGLFHSDHRLAADACLQALRRSPIEALAYEDAIYRRIPGELQGRLAELARRGIRATPAALPRGSRGAKRAAVACYASQLRALGSRGRPGHADVFADERFWRLEWSA